MTVEPRPEAVKLAAFDADDLEIRFEPFDRPHRSTYGHGVHEWTSATYGLVHVTWQPPEGPPYHFWSGSERRLTQADLEDEDFRLRAAETMREVVADYERKAANEPAPCSVCGGVTGHKVGCPEMDKPR